MKTDQTKNGGVVGGLFWSFLERIASQLVSMIVGRLVWGVAMFVCTGIKGSGFTFSAFLSGAVLNAIPGIIVQIVLVPVLVMLLESLKLYRKEL